MLDRNNKITLVISDIGGVLIKTDEAIISAIKKAIAQRGFPGGSVDNMFAVFGVSLKEYVRAYLPESHKDKTDECYEEFRRIYPTRMLPLLKPYKGVEGTLASLKEQGFRIAAFSCMHRDEVEVNLSLLKFRDFDAVFSLDDYGESHRRPDPQGLLILIDRLRCKPSESIYVGDTEQDVLMARNARVISVGARSGAQPVSYIERAKPDHMVDQFRDILTEVLPHYNVN